MGWSATREVIPSDGGDLVQVAMFDRAGDPLAGLHLEGQLRHPVNAHLDRPLTFVDVGGGKYQAATDHLPKGGWTLHFSVLTANEKIFESETRLWLP